MLTQQFPFWYKVKFNSRNISSFSLLMRFYLWQVGGIWNWNLGLLSIYANIESLLVLTGFYRYDCMTNALNFIKYPAIFLFAIMSLVNKLLYFKPLPWGKNNFVSFSCSCNRITSNWVSFFNVSSDSKILSLILNLWS